MTQDQDQQQRLKSANEFIRVIASCGRNFLSSNSDLKNKSDHPFVCFLELDDRGRVWFTDRYNKKRIYTHYPGRWRGFSEGGTLKMIIEQLRDFVKKSSTMRAEGFSNHWGYGEDILIVKNAAIALGIAKETGAKKQREMLRDKIIK